MNVTGWPYAIAVGGDVSEGAGGRLTIEFSTAPVSEIVDQVTFAVESFAALAEAGGLGGDRVNPRQSTAILSTDAPATHRTQLTWEFTTLAIDPRGLAVLFNMLTFLGKDIQAVTLQSLESGPSVPFSIGDLPPMWHDVPFEMDDDRTCPNVEVQIAIAKAMPPELREMVIDAVEAWLNCGMVQGYRGWTEPDDLSFLVPLSDPTFEFTDGSFVGKFQDNGIAEEAYDIFINILIKLHTMTQIKSVELL